jgi:hypothetical protein
MSTAAPPDVARSDGPLRVPGVPGLPARRALVLAVTVLTAAAAVALAIAGGLLALGMVSAGPDPAPVHREAAPTVRQPAGAVTGVRPRPHRPHAQRAPARHAAHRR